MMYLLVNAPVALGLPMSKILALDQSSHTTGYTVLDDGKIIKVSHFECIGNDLGDRLVQLRAKVVSLINEYDIDEVVFEDIQLQDVEGSREKGVKTFKILAEAFGTVHELLTEIKMPYSVALPIKWKAHFKIAGKGRTQEKKMAQAYVLKNYNIKCTEDEADSLCIALYHYDNSNVFDWS